MSKRKLALRAPEAIAADGVLMVDRGRPGPRQLPASITIDSRRELFGGGRMVPMQFIEPLAHVEIVDGRIVSPVLDKFSSYVDGAFDGGTVHRFRPSETGVREIAPLRITRTRINRLDTPARRFNYLAPGDTLRWSPPRVFQPAQSLLWGLCYVHEDGRFSKAAAGPTYTTTDRPDTPKEGTGDVPDTDIDSLRAVSVGHLAEPMAGFGDAPPQGPTIATANEGRQVVITMPDVALPDGVVGLAPVYSVRGDMEAELALEVEGATDLSTDDVHVIRKVLGNDVERARFVHPRLYGSSVVKVAPKTLETEFAGEPNRSGAFYRWVEDDRYGSALRVHLPPGSRYQITLMEHGGTGGAFYPLLEPDVPCHGTARLRHVGGTVGAVVEWNGFERDGGPTPTDPVRLDADWHETTATRPAPNPPLDIKGVARVQLTLRGGPDGGVVDVESAWFRAGVQLHEYPVNELADLQTFQPRAFRDHQVKKRPNGMSLEMALDNALGVPSWQGQSHVRTFKTVAWLRDQGIETIPWVQPPWFWTDAEIDGYWEYCCTPFDPAVDHAADKPWAARRHAHGFADTIQNSFPQLQIEVGNELWQGSNVFYNFSGMSASFSSGRLAGMMTNRWAERARANPHFDRSRWTFYGGGWGGAGGSYAQGRDGSGGFDYSRSNFNGDFMAQCPELDAFGYATYMGGWDSGEGVLQSDTFGRFYLLSDPFGGEARRGPSVRSIIERLVEDARLYERDTGRPLRTEHYETGPGYDPYERDRDKKHAQSAMMKGRVSGAAFLALVLRSAAIGLTATNFFTFGRGEMFHSHSADNVGGAPSAAWQWIAWMNRWALGETVVLDCEQGGSIFGPATRDAVENTVYGGQDAAAFRVVGDGYVTYVAFNFRQDRDVAIHLMKPRHIAGPVTRWEMTGTLESTNGSFDTRDDLRLVRTPEPDGFGAEDIRASIPPGSAIAWVFEANV